MIDQNTGDPNNEANAIDVDQTEVVKGANEETRPNQEQAQALVKLFFSWTVEAMLCSKALAPPSIQDTLEIIANVTIKNPCELIAYQHAEVAELFAGQALVDAWGTIIEQRLDAMTEPYRSEIVNFLLGELNNTPSWQRFLQMRRGILSINEIEKR
jgi:hypothetical protein